MRLAGIQSRVMLIALLPALILAVSLTYFHTRSRMAEIEQAVLDKGAAVARHLAPGSEFGVVTGNDELLQSIAESALQDNDFVRIVIRDQSGEVLIDPLLDPNDNTIDHVQYTRREWRNRNRIKTPQGSQWLSIPVEVKAYVDGRVVREQRAVDGR